MVTTRGQLQRFLTTPTPSIVPFGISVYVRLSAQRAGPKARPDFFSKANCLRSLIRASAGRPFVNLNFLTGDEISRETRVILEHYGAVRDSPRGHVGSFRAQLDHACQATSTHFLLVEDDYLFMPETFDELLALCTTAPGLDYFTPYDHPDRYSRDDDLWCGRRFVIRAPQLWGTIESTPMTFGGRVDVLIQDASLFRLTAVGVGTQSRLAWRAIAARRWYPPLILRALVRAPTLSAQDLPAAVASLRRRRRVLVAPLNGLAVHCELDQLSSGRDWSTCAAEAENWAADSDLMDVRF